MYKLSSQFDPVPRAVVPSAGGGCSCCCCCCCVVTTVATPILTSMHFYRIKPSVTPIEADSPGDVQAEQEVSGGTDGANSHDRMLLAMLGLFALPLALWAKGWLLTPLFMRLFLPSPNLQTVLFVESGISTLLIFGGLFAFVYKRRQKQAGKGFLVGVAAAIAFMTFNFLLYWSNIPAAGFVSPWLVYFLLLAIAAILTSSHFYRLESVPEPALGDSPADARAGAAITGESTGLPASGASPDRAWWAVAGFFALPLALVTAWLAWLLGESVDYSFRQAVWIVGGILAVMVFSSMFALAYHRYQNQTGKGFGIGILASVIYLLACVGEFFIWLSFMK